VPVIYEAHDLESRNPSRAKERWAQPWLVRLDRDALSKSSAVVSLTEDFRRLLGSAGWPRPARVAGIPAAFDERPMWPGDRAAARRRLGLDPTGPLIVDAGMTFSHRGIDRLLPALGELRRELPAARLALVGGRPAEIAELTRRAAELSLERDVNWTGQLPQGE